MTKDCLEYCESFYQEKVAEINFRRKSLSPELFDEYIRENLKKWVQLIEDYEREIRKGLYEGDTPAGYVYVWTFTNNGNVVKRATLRMGIESLKYTLPLWQGAKVTKRYPDKWFALLHAVYIKIGKTDQFTVGDKRSIIDYGSRRYGTGQGFYATFINIDLNDIHRTIRSFPSKDRPTWKQILIEVSENDADIIAWTGKQPN